MIYGKHTLFRITLQNHIIKNLPRLGWACLVFSLLAGTPGWVGARGPLFSKIKKTIVLDPGHGGRDSGAKGADNTFEKDITLAYAKFLEEQLKATYNVVLTRNGDYDQDLTTRTETANRLAGDLFISLHAGGNFIHDSQGVGIYYYEKETIPGRAPEPRGQRRWDDAQQKYSAVSRAFALSLKDRLSTKPDFSNITVEEVALKVLAGADMPAILIEPGYVTSPHDEKRLNDSGYVHDFSNEVCAGINEYFNAYSQSY